MRSTREESENCESRGWRWRLLVFGLAAGLLGCTADPAVEIDEPGVESSVDQPTDTDGTTTTSAASGSSDDAEEPSAGDDAVQDDAPAGDDESGEVSGDGTDTDGDSETDAETDGEPDPPATTVPDPGVSSET